jgi:hypothetical protein
VGYFFIAGAWLTAAISVAVDGSVVWIGLADFGRGLTCALPIPVAGMKVILQVPALGAAALALALWLRRHDRWIVRLVLAKGDSIGPG